MNYCPECGTHTVNFKYPYKCVSCNSMFWNNPKPAANAILPVIGKDGVTRILLIKRAIEPERGKWALPGGYMDYGESWEQSVVRELFEETGVFTDPAGVKLFQVKNSSANDHVLVFGECMTMLEEELIAFEPNDESEAMGLFDYEWICKTDQMAFSTHKETLIDFLKE